MHLALIFVAIILFVLDALSSSVPRVSGWSGWLQSFGLAFFAASFVVGG